MSLILDVALKVRQLLLTIDNQRKLSHKLNLKIKDVSRPLCLSKVRIKIINQLMKFSKI
jgi:hypothetical protein